MTGDDDRHGAAADGRIGEREPDADAEAADDDPGERSPPRASTGVPS